MHVRTRGAEDGGLVDFQKVIGFLNADDTFNGRPAYIHQQPDGSLLISDEQLGAIYRVSYSR